MTLRPGPILAIAHRDLRAELAGRQGLGLPIVALALLLPVSMIPLPSGGEAEILPVQGDVPEAVLAIPGARKMGAGTGFRQRDGVTLVYDFRIDPRIRSALDGDAPAIRAEEVSRPPPVPKRSLMFALISASTLTGAVSTSIGGERARNTLQALLSAAVTRMEIVLGKWLAWTGFGALGGMVATLGALLGGTQAPGVWVLAVPVVPALTVAIGLWLVRRTEDVIAGTSVSLRVLPAVLMGAGLVAYTLSQVHPLLGAVIPLGGALLAAGDLWEGAVLPTLVALLSAGLTTVLLIVATARDLEQHVPFGESHRVRPLRAAWDGAVALGIWWAIVPGPVLWGWAGSEAMTAAIGVERGLLAGSAMLLTLATVAFVRATHPSDRPAVRGLDPVAIGIGGTLAGLAVALSGGIGSTNPWLVEAGGRLHAGLQPGVLVAVPVLLAQEAWFRGVVQHRAGWIPAALAFAVAMSPLDPVAGLAVGLGVGWAGRTSLLSALLARLVAWGVALGALALL